MYRTSCAWVECLKGLRTFSYLFLQTVSKGKGLSVGQPLFIKAEFKLQMQRNSY